MHQHVTDDVERALELLRDGRDACWRDRRAELVDRFCQLLARHRRCSVAQKQRVEREQAFLAIRIEERASFDGDANGDERERMILDDSHHEPVVERLRTYRRESDTRGRRSRRSLASIQPLRRGDSRRRERRCGRDRNEACYSGSMAYSERARHRFSGTTDEYFSDFRSGLLTSSGFPAGTMLITTRPGPRYFCAARCTSAGVSRAA